MNDFAKYDLKQSKRTTPALPLGLAFLRDIEIVPPKFLVESILPLSCLIAVVGPSYTYKSFLMIDIALCIAAGVPFNGLEVQQGTVIYVTGEGRIGISKRIAAWCMKHSQSDEELPFILSQTAINFRDVENIKQLKTLHEQVDNISLIVIDTLNRNSGGMNENAPADMSEFINACSELVDHFGCSVCVVHHTGKDANGARGHSSFYAALDTELTTKRVGQHDVLLKCTKQKDAPEFADMQFMAVTTGNSITLDQIEVQKFDKKYELKGDHRLAFDCFNELLEGKQATIGNVAAQNVKLDDWRNLFKQRHAGDNDKSKNTAHLRARKSLLHWGFLDVKDDVYSLGDKATRGDK
ncbi:helicase RepA family protein [Paracoccaceae bacterium]|nr:helicase RepA family protein [Paracoccaceae bacterium]